MAHNLNKQFECFTIKEYNELLNFAKQLISKNSLSVAPEDVVHDAYVEDSQPTKATVSKIFYKIRSIIRKKWKDADGRYCSDKNIYKVCPHCKEPLPVSYFREVYDSRIHLLYSFFICKDCEPAYKREKNKKYRQANPKKYLLLHSIRSKRYYDQAKNTKRFKEARKLYLQKTAAYRRKKYTDEKNNLSDKYIKHCIYTKYKKRGKKIMLDDITLAMIKKSRTEIIAYRERKHKKAV